MGNSIEIEIIDERPSTQQFFITPYPVVTSLPYDPGYEPEFRNSEPSKSKGLLEESFTPSPVITSVPDPAYEQEFSLKSEPSKPKGLLEESFTPSPVITSVPDDPANKPGFRNSEPSKLKVKESFTPTPVITSVPDDRANKPEFSLKSEPSKLKELLKSFKQSFQTSLLGKLLAWIGQHISESISKLLSHTHDAASNKEKVNETRASLANTHSPHVQIDLGVSSSSFTPDASRHASDKENEVPKQDGVKVKNQSKSRLSFSKMKRSRPLSQLLRFP